MYCSFCGNYVEDDLSFCTNCGKNLTGAKQVFNSSNETTATISFSFDKRSILCTFLSLCVILSFMFLDVFYASVSSGYKTALTRYGLFSGVSVRGSSYSSEAFDVPLINLMFFALALTFIIMIMCIITKKHIGIIICSFANLLILFVGFLIFAIFTRTTMEYLSKMPVNYDGDISLLTLPGIGLIISFISSIILTFYSIFTLPNRS